MAQIHRPLPSTLGLPLTGVDAHAHLESLLPRLPEVLESARLAGVALVVQNFLSLASWHTHRSVLAAHDNLLFTVGLHPNEVHKQASVSQTINGLTAAFAADTRLCAVGETGLDFYWKDAPPALQEEAFRAQLHLARTINKPVVIHSRDAATATLRVLEEEGFAGRPLLWHCFSGDAVAHLDRLLANGWHVSIPGPVTYSANAPLHAAVQRIPADRLLIETDCPYLAPEPWRGKPNEPAFAAFTGVALARLRDEDPTEMWTACGKNAVRFYTDSMTQ